MILKLYEYIKNENNALYFVDKIINEIKSKLPYTTSTKVLDKKLYFRFQIFYVKPSDTKIVERILKKYTDLLEKEELLLTYKEKGNAYTGLFTHSYNIYIKSHKIERVLPPEFIYHTSPPKNRDLILKDGLKPMVGTWGADLEYKPAIFASVDERILFSLYGKDVWEIDTKKLKNIWYLDLNLNKYANEIYNNFIMTYEPIPPEFIKLRQKAQQKDEI